MWILSGEDQITLLELATIDHLKQQAEVSSRENHQQQKIAWIGTLVPQNKTLVPSKGEIIQLSTSNQGTLSKNKRI